MESQKNKMKDLSPQPVEHDYNKHKNNPGPSPEAVEEKNENGGGLALKWVIPITIFILLAIWYLFFRTEI